MYDSGGYIRLEYDIGIGNGRSVNSFDKWRPADTAALWNDFAVVARLKNE